MTLPKRILGCILKDCFKHVIIKHEAITDNHIHNILPSKGKGKTTRSFIFVSQSSGEYNYAKSLLHKTFVSRQMYAFRIYLLSN